MNFFINVFIAISIFVTISMVGIYKYYLTRIQKLFLRYQFQRFVRNNLFKTTPVPVSSSIVTTTATISSETVKNLVQTLLDEEKAFSFYNSLIDNRGYMLYKNDDSNNSVAMIPYFESIFSLLTRDDNFASDDDDDDDGIVFGTINQFEIVVERVPKIVKAYWTTKTHNYRIDCTELILLFCGVFHTFYQDEYFACDDIGNASVITGAKNIVKILKREYCRVEQIDEATINSLEIHYDRYPFLIFIE